MIRSVIAATMLTLVGAATAASQPTVFLVRHAERADTATTGPAMMANDPDLSPAGQSRAESLAKMLKDAKITVIYTSEYKRTKQTAAPLAKTLGFEPMTVPSKDVASLVQKIKAATGNVLVVGHSNTIPDLIKALGISEPLTIADSEFDNVFVVQRGSLVRLHY